METLNMGADIGNSQIKVVYDNGRFSFPSLIDSGFDDFSKIQKIHSIYDNADYSVGIGNEITNRAKYFNKYYKVLFLSAIGKIIPDNVAYAKINVVSSLPVDTFKDKELKEKIISEISSWKLETIIVDGKEKNFSVNKVDIWVESGILVSEPQKYKSKKIIVMDIGGFTQDSIEFVFNDIVKSKTEKKGIIILREELHNIFKEEYHLQLDETGKSELFEKAISGRKFSFANKSISLEKYYQCINNYVSDIFSDLERTYNLSDKELIFIGGGSLALAPIINKYKDFYSLTVSDQAMYLNAQSNYDFCKNILDTKL